MIRTKCLLLLLTCFTFAIGHAQNKKGFIPDSTSYVVLSQPSEMTKNARLVYCNILKYPLLFTDDKLLLLADCTKKPIYFTIPESVNQCESVFVIDSLLICKSKRNIKCYTGNNFKDILVMQDDNYNIYPASGQYFYLVKNDIKSSSVYLVDMLTGDYFKLFDTPFIIDNLAGIGMECYVTSGQQIYFISDKICTVIEVADSKVQSLDFYDGGVFYSTEKACYYMGLPGKSYPFLLGDIKQLMLVDNHLYLLFRDGLLSVISNANGYKRFLDEFIKEKNEKNEIH